MSSFKHISISDVKKLVDDQAAQIVDIRDPQSFQHSHIKGAINLNGDSVSHFVLEANKEKPLICYCYHGNSSQSAASYFIQQGFKDVYSMDGGFEEWRTVYV